MPSSTWPFDLKFRSKKKAQPGHDRAKTKKPAGRRLFLEQLEQRLLLNFDVEPNDNLAEALVLSPGAVEGFIGNGSAGAQDEDFYQFSLDGNDLASFGGYGYGGYNYGNGTSLRLL